MVLATAVGFLVLTHTLFAWLVRATGQAVAPSYYVAGCAAVSLVAILAMRDRSREEA